VRPSVETCHEVARSGWSVPDEVGNTRVSYRLARAAELASSDPLAGSVTGTLANVMLRVPEASPVEDVVVVLVVVVEVVVVLVVVVVVVVVLVEVET